MLAPTNSDNSPQAHTSSSPNTPAKPWRVLIVEDDPTTRAFFVSSVRRNPRLQLEADVASVAEALAWLGSAANQGAYSLDVLLTDLGLPDGSGLEVIRYAVQHHPLCEALVISMFGDEDNVLASIEAGALGYIHKDSAPEDVAQSILDLKAGVSPISPMIARRVLGKYRSLMADKTSLGAYLSVKAPGTSINSAQAATKNIANNMALQASGLMPPVLSGREQEVLSLIARGFSYIEIARINEVSVHTVQSHIKNLYNKLAVHNKTEAVFEATRLGLLRS